MSRWERFFYFYIDWDKIEAKRAMKRRLKAQRLSQSGKGGKLIPVIVAAVLSVILITLITLIALLLSGKGANMITRAINRARTLTVYENYILDDTGETVRLKGLQKSLTTEEELLAYEEAVETYTANPGITAIWFEYLIMDEWDFSMANEDVMYEIGPGNAETLLALCSRHGYPQFEEDYAFYVYDDFEEEEGKEEEFVEDETETDYEIEYVDP